MKAIPSLAPHQPTWALVNERTCILYVFLYFSPFFFGWEVDEVLE